MSRYDLELGGCRTEPLSGYLKSLGVLRLVAEQKDPEVRGYWAGDTFQLRTSLSEGDLLAFFRNEYSPTPILDPWNAGSGFWDRTTANATLRAISERKDSRLTAYRESIAIAWEILRDLSLKGKPSKEEKVKILRLCRNRLPDSAVDWLDTAYALSTEKPRYAPVLGTGGNDGKLDFSNNFMQHVLRIIPPDTANGGGPRKRNKDAENASEQLETALFGRGCAALTDAAIGQFSPGAVGGPNGLQGFEAPSLVNSWDFIFMIEGTLFFAGSVAWRLKGVARSTASFPFTVAASPAGWGTLTETGESARAEIWLPTWERPSTKEELARLFSEGRADVGHRPAQNGTDFARAAASLGVDRGVAYFCRYGLLRRSGKAHLAAPVGKVRVGENEYVDLLQDVDGWLNRYRQIAREDESPASVKQAFNRIDQSIFSFCAHGGALALQQVLRAMGAAERILANSRRLKEALAPLQGLSLAWLNACDDASPEFRIAAALASISHPGVGPIRTNLEPVVWGGGAWIWSAGGSDLVYDANLCRTLVSLLERRMLAAEKLGGERAGNPEKEDRMSGASLLPISGRIRARASDLAAFLAGAVDDDRISELMWGLCALDWRKTRGYEPWPNERTEEVGLSGLYALIKLVFWPGEIRVSPEAEPIAVHPEKAILNRLQAGDIEASVRIAARRLRASGLRVLGDHQRGAEVPGFIVGQNERQRLGAALLIPIGGLRDLLRMVLRTETKQFAGGIV